MKLTDIEKDVERLANPERAKASLWYFKTGKGQYGENDTFIGLTVPQSRIIAKKYATLPLSLVEKLLHSPLHEERLIALLILVNYSMKGDSQMQKKVYDLYLKNTRYINNWDLVDTSAGAIVGTYLMDKPKDILYTLATSQNLWERRIAIIATSKFIRMDLYEDTLKISELLLDDTHDLIHKAVGWMLREVGNRSREAEEQFLKKHYTRMPRTMLRYAIEKFPEPLRKAYLRGSI